jgi:hypothetical protein
MILLIGLLSIIMVASNVWLQTERRKMTTKTVPPLWSELDVSNLRRSFRDARLLRTEDDVRGKARDLGIALGVS